MNAEKHENNQENRQSGKMEPMMIELFFDNEIKPDEISSQARAEMSQTKTWKALSELRNVVRAGGEHSRKLMGDFDAYALLDSINGQIEQIEGQNKAANTEKRPGVEEKASVRHTPKHGIVRWIPAFAAAALFMASLPGLVQLVRATDEKPLTPNTVVYINDAAGQTGYGAKPQKSEFVEEIQQIAHKVAVPSHPTADSQLTVEELDFALRRLVNRIETLEEANRQDIEHGAKAIHPVDSENPHEL